MGAGDSKTDEKGDETLSGEDRASIAAEQSESDLFLKKPFYSTHNTLVIVGILQIGERAAAAEAPVDSSHGESFLSYPLLNTQETPNEGSFGARILDHASGVTIQDSTIIAQSFSTTNNTNVTYRIVQSEIPNKDVQLFKAIVEWLSDINYRAIQADNLRKRVSGTVKWTLVNPVILNWLAGIDRILWGVGMPGAGKTVLASYIVNHLAARAKANKRICVAFAYCRYTDKFTGDKILGGLLRQVVEDHPATLQFVKPMYDYHLLRKTRPPQAELLDVLRAVFSSDLFDEKFCSLDGLDEALNDTQIDVLDSLAELPVNILLTSRSLPLLKERVPEAKFIDIMLHDADIEPLIKEKLGRMKTLRNLMEKDGWKDKVLKVILERSSGMFLIASLQLDMLGRCLHLKDLRKALETLPRGLEAMYTATMERIENNDGSELARRALAWLVYAQGSLTVDDLRHALAVDPSNFTFDSELLVDADTLISLCCGLITLEPETEMVRLVHYTAKDILDKYLSREGINLQAQLASTCAAYLLLHGFDNFPGTADTYSLSTNVPGTADRLSRSIYHRYRPEVFRAIPFLKYCHSNWATHARLADTLPQSVANFVGGCPRFPWLAKSGSSTWDYLDAFQLAAACNFHDLLAQWLFQSPRPLNSTLLDINVNSRSEKGRTALALAAMGGYVETVRLLLGVDSDDAARADNYGFTPLRVACSRNHVQVVDVLLEVLDADDVNAGRPNMTALMSASMEGFTDVIRSLLRVPGIDVNAYNVPVQLTALGFALLLPNARPFNTLRLLLAADGIDVNVSGSNGTVLIMASTQGDKEVVQLLLQQEDINVNATVSDSGETALMRASQRVQNSVVQLLLRREEIDVNAKDIKGETALMKTFTRVGTHATASRGRSRLDDGLGKCLRLVVELLLQRKDIDVNATNSAGETALSLALKEGHDTDVVTLLKAHGACGPTQVPDTYTGTLTFLATENASL
ncbi:ankyrin [Coprinopsis marcescibilis]|uniref:Ankyrin n=1 Tax=Coprinopsis marcescibilis TaxID=230819 RepID=A0A5C3KCH5_COPMA|nr:ankyrin [Coprinopsis marcescibilis]